MRDVGQMLVRAFYPELLQVGATFSPVELALLEPPVAWLNDSLAAYLAQSITKYIERRIGADRLEASSRSASVHTPRLRPGTTVGSSLALAAADAATGELLAFVELSVRPLDGRVPTDMLEDIEALLRVLLPAPGAQCAYLSNLCVARAARRRGIGSALVRASERVVGPAGWGHDALYLHVGMHDAPTSRLYRALGFEPLTQYDPQPWQVKWLGAAECTFYERRLEPAARAAISRGAAAGAEGQPPLGA
jgi:GNAT superfamily N-acetyltransferase